MARYFVDASRPDDTGNGLTWAAAKKTIQASIDLATTAGDVVEIAYGSYAEDIDTKFNGTSPAPIKIIASKDPDHSQLITVGPRDFYRPVVIDGSGVTDANGHIDVNHDYIQFRGPMQWISGANVTRALYQRLNATNLEIYDIEIVAQEDVYIGDTGFKAYRCEFKGVTSNFAAPTGTTYGFSLDKGGYFEGCKFAPAYISGIGWVRPQYIRCRDISGTLAASTFNDCTFDGFWTHILECATATAVINLNNCILGGYNYGVGVTRATPVYFSAAGTVNAVDVQHVGRWSGQNFALTSGGTGSSIETRVTVDQPLKLTEHTAGVGGVCFTVDDGKTSSMQYIADLLSGLSGDEVVTWFVDQRIFSETPPAGYTGASLLRAAQSAGFEIASGGLTGGDMSGMTEAEFRADILSNKATLEATLGNGYQIKTHSWGGGFTNANMQTWLQSMGFIAARSSANSITTLASQNIFNMEIWDNIPGTPHAIFTGDTTDAGLQQQGIASATNCRANGTLKSVLSHDSSDLPTAQAISFIKGAAKTGYLKTFRALIEEYLENPNTVNVDNLTHTNIMQDAEDFTLQAGAFAEDAGSKWWSTAARPTGLDHEPFSFYDISLGAYQSRNTPFCVANL